MTPTIAAYIGLGANVGDRGANIAAALERLSQTPGVTVVRVSNLLENPAVGMDDHAPPFLNAAARIDTTLGPQTLLERLLEIEKEMGRQRREKWEPRIIDLDLLLYGDQIIATEDLMVPHPLMHERRFVIEPLAEIAPDLVHPTLQMTMAGLLENPRHVAAE